MRALQELRRLRSKYHDLFDFFCRARGILTKRVILIIAYNFVNCVLFTFYGFVDGLKTTWRLSLVSEWVTAFFWASCCFFGLYVLIPPFERIFRQVRKPSSPPRAPFSDRSFVPGAFHCRRRPVSGHPPGIQRQLLQ